MEHSLYELIKKNRSYRRFHEEVTIPLAQLKDFIELARVSPSARNAQPLKYIISNSPEMNEKIFPNLSWAGYLVGWGGPQKGERPSAYIVIVQDTRITDNIFCDHGIASQSILLGAVEKGFGGCIIASVNRVKLTEALQIPPHFQVVQVIALGKPKETVQLENMKADGDYKYWRDEQMIHHVPKRSLDDLIISL